MAKIDNITKETALMTAFLFFGLFLPTSINGVFGSMENTINIGLVIVLYAVAIWNSGAIYLPGTWIFSGGTALLIVYTTLSDPLGSAGESYWGTVASMTAILLMLVVPFYKMNVSKRIIVMFVIANSIICILNIGVMLRLSWVNGVISSYYSYFYPELLPSMLSAGKPIATFATHSVAGFYLFLLFYLCLRSNSVAKIKVFIVFLPAYIISMLSLESNTGYFFAICSITLLFHQYLRRRYIPQLLIFVAICTLAALWRWSSIVNYVEVAIAKSVYMASSSNNGVIGRYSNNGVLETAVNYLSNNLFNGVGYAYSNKLVVIDSGYIATMVRGGLLLLCLIYGGIFMFLRKNLLNIMDLSIVCGSLFLFEIGFYNVSYFRAFYLLPFAIVYLNFIQVNVSKSKTKQVSFSFGRMR